MTNLVELRKLKNYSKLSKSKKTILNKFKILVNLTMAINADAIEYLIIKTKIAFTWLRQEFIKAPIFQNLDLECHIQIEIVAPSFAIGGVLSQLTLDGLSQ